MTKESPLGKLIASLQKKILEDGLDKASIEGAIKELENLGYQYNEDRFPPLVGTENFSNNISDSPQDLAEALLWKLGRWKAYKRFCETYAAEQPVPTKTDVVFYAFAMHLRDKNNPIYDQHAIRSLWAVFGKLTADERQKCKSLLFDKKNKWKQSGTGKSAVDCYTIFVKYVNDLIAASGGANKSELDRLLMPLGQAIKESTETYAEFDALCGWPGSG
ncbi:hypothetical protein FXN65_17710 [Metapseudomonas lalkuanensis]|uniref:Uncharacterized protein n=1 Tax=Metapseudomonas lalkuanensis TaxID=2604832 RepID=A0A5J6QNE3_9GAMM|nr:hypothetical protein [Pseudomonas lalkuanensis]QEY63797.1 hypothetical protein FXN65_17710 [Pseudomonas lalkuanensis]